MRDALGFLDQILVFSDKKITNEIVVDILGIIPTEVYFDITNALHEKDGEKLIESIQHIKENGYIIEDLIRGLIGHIRNLTLMHYKNGLDLIGVSPEMKKLYKKNNYDWSLKDLVRMSNNLSEMYASIKRFSDQALIFEMTLMKFLQFDKSIDIERFLDSDIVVKEEKIEEKPKKIATKKDKKKEEKEAVETVGDIKKDWKKVLEAIGSERGSVHALLSECIVKEIKGNTLELISYDSNEFNQQLMNDNLDFVEECINKTLNISLSVKITVDTNVEKIDDEQNSNSVDQNDVMELFEGKDTM